ncbi:MAG: DUF4129 domain-containing protein [Dermatophilaceae bacterium]
MGTRRWHSPVQGLVIVGAISTVLVASRGEFSLFGSSRPSGSDAVIGDAIRYESPPALTERLSGSGPAWIGPVVGVGSLVTLVLLGLLWFRHRRRQGGGADAAAFREGAGDRTVVDTPASDAASDAATGTEAAGAVQQAWYRVERTLCGRDVVLAPSRTARSTGAAAVAVGAPAAAVAELVELYDRARYSGRPVDRSDEARAVRLAGEVTGAVAAR